MAHPVVHSMHAQYSRAPHGHAHGQYIKTWSLDLSIEVDQESAWDVLRIPIRPDPLFAVVPPLTSLRPCSASLDHQTEHRWRAVWAIHPRVPLFTCKPSGWAGTWESTSAFLCYEYYEYYQFGQLRCKYNKAWLHWVDILVGPQWRTEKTKKTNRK